LYILKRDPGKGGGQHNALRQFTLTGHQEL
jgi:hypothetical protein